MSLPVAVIGGGYAGMAAAVTLCEHGVKPIVFETGKVLGGRARRIEYRGVTLDNGQHILSGAYTELLRLMEIVGVPSQALLRVPLRLDLAPHFSLRTPKLPAPWHMAAALFFAKGLSWNERILLASMMRALKGGGFRLDANLTVAALLAQHKQTDTLIRYFWQPLTVAALNTPIASASAQVLVNVLRDTLASDRSASDLLLPRVDLSALFPEPAAQFVQQKGGTIHLGKRVQTIAAEDTGFGIIAEDVKTKVAAIILAIGPHQLDDLVLPIAMPAPFHYEPIYTVYLQYPKTVGLAFPMQGCTEGVVQWYFDRTALSFDKHGTAGLVAAVISASGAHQSLDSESLAEIAHRELIQQVGELPTPTWHKVIAEKFATFACAAGLSRPSSNTSHPRFFLAGDYVANDYPATLEGAVRNGVAAAKLVAQAITK